MRSRLEDAVLRAGQEFLNFFCPLEQYALRGDNQGRLWLPRSKGTQTGQEQHAGRLSRTNIAGQYGPLDPNFDVIFDLLSFVQLMVLDKRIEVEPRVEQGNHGSGFDPGERIFLQIQHPANLLSLVVEEHPALRLLRPRKAFVVFGGFYVSDADILFVLQHVISVFLEEFLEERDLEASK